MREARQQQPQEEQPPPPPQQRQLLQQLRRSPEQRIEIGELFHESYVNKGFVF